MNDKSSFTGRTCSFVLFEVKCIFLISNNFYQIDNIDVIQLPQDLDFSNSCDRKPFFLVFQAYFLQGDGIT